MLIKDHEPHDLGQSFGQRIEPYWRFVNREEH